MRQVSIARVAIVTLALVIVGALIGALTSVLALVVVLMLRGSPGFPQLLAAIMMAGYVGAAIGAVMAPIVAWVLLRRVPLWRAITQTALGTLLGAIVTSFTFPGPIIGAIIGFTLAAIRLRIVTRPDAALADTDSRPALP
jgi:hypothetical protein